MVTDHFYICTAEPDRAAEVLRDFGLEEGAPNTHPGQGTANRRFFFRNSMMEILYVVREEEMDSELVQPLGIAAQFRDPARNRIGLVLRPSEGGGADFPVASRIYRPAYLPPGLVMHVADGTSEQEPKIIFLGFAGPPVNREDLSHTLGGKVVRDVTGLNLKLAASECSQALALLSREAGFRVQPGTEDVLEVELDGGQTSGERDFRPLLPLRIRW